MFPRAISAALPNLEPAAPPLPDAARAATTKRRAPCRGPTAAAPASPAAGADPLTLRGLDACVAEARAAASRDVPVPDPERFAALRARLAAACRALPPEYQRAVGEPLLATLDRLGAKGFARVLAEDPDRTGSARLLLDLCEAVLQRGEGYQPKATAAFQEVVSDLYDGFLSAEDRRGVKPPDHGVAAPLVRWGGEGGPSTWPATAGEIVGAQVGVVNLPAANATAGLLAWPALAHETAGHDILEADDGLRDELAKDVRGQLLSAGMPLAVADYWADRIDETASDVLGVLNMGPAAAAGLVGYFRALNGAVSGDARLRNVGRTEDPHPADIARAYVAAETVRLLSFQGAGAWADRLVAEADRDVGRIRLGDVAVTTAVAKESAAIVARAIVRTPLHSLEGKALGKIQDWSDRDEAVVARLREVVRDPRGDAAAGAAQTGASAAHAVAAGVYEALAGAPPAEVMGRMIGVLDAMHAQNPEWSGRLAQLTAGARPSRTWGS